MAVVQGRAIGSRGTDGGIRGMPTAPPAVGCVHEHTLCCILHHVGLDLLHHLRAKTGRRRSAWDLRQG